MNRRLFSILLSTLLAGVSPAAEKPPLQVYILAGQSNMQGHAKVSTFAHLGMDPATKPMLERMQHPDGSPRVSERVWISSIGCGPDETTEQTGKLTAGFGASNAGPKIGPEFTFGLYLEETTQAPILLIKTSWGGKSLNTDFRPPGAGPYVFNETQLATLEKQGKDLAAIRAEREAATGVYYRRMVEHVKAVLGDLKRVVPDFDPSQGHELAGFVWFQGWNDLVDSGTYPDRDKAGGYDAYTDVMGHFIRDVRRDLNVPTLPFVIGVLGVGGPTSAYGPDQQRYKTTHENFRKAMEAPAALPEFKGSVVAVRTENYWDRELTLARSKENQFREKAKKLAKEQNLKPPAEKNLFDSLRAEGLNDRERLVLDTGVSNAEYHYLGSAKILGGIGKGFAEAILNLSARN